MRDALIFVFALALIVWNLTHGQARAQTSLTTGSIVYGKGVSYPTDEQLDAAMAICDGHKVTAPDQTPIYDEPWRTQCEAIHKRYVEVRVPKLAQERADAEKARREFVDKIAKEIEQQ